jgi:hypothetical protein
MAQHAFDGTTRSAWGTVRSRRSQRGVTQVLLSQARDRWSKENDWPSAFFLLHSALFINNTLTGVTRHKLSNVVNSGAGINRMQWRIGLPKKPLLSILYEAPVLVEQAFLVGSE